MDLVNRTPPETILIIDDQEQNLRVIGTVLSTDGYQIIRASSGDEAFEQLAANTPDLILLDMLMPRMSGIEVCGKLQENAGWAEIPVIFLSAEDNKNLIVEALECGGVDYVIKPFYKAELLSRVRTHLTLKRTREEMRHLAEDKDELLGMLTHDLGNDLTSIRLNAVALKSELGTIPPHCAPLIENIVRASESITAFVQDFLANQSAERIHVQMDRVDLRAVLKTAAETHALMARAKNITLSLDLPKTAAIANADQEALQRVLGNLLSNAIKFSPAGSQVTLTAGAEQPEWAQFSIRDEGPGFTAEDQGKMFRRYARLSARPTGGEASTGLGLSIVKRLVENMNGYITVDSQEGAGACITVHLPAATL